MRHSLMAASVAAVLLLGSGCVSTQPESASPDRVVQRILLSTVQVVVGRNGHRFRSSSGVVIGTRRSADGNDCVVITADHTLAHLAEDGTDTIDVLFERDRGAGIASRATVLARGDRYESDLALLGVRPGRCVVAQLGRSLALGTSVWIVGFPWGGSVRLGRGIISQVASGGSGAGSPIIVDASVASGDSGGGVFEASGGRLVGLVEGYGTARVSFGESDAPKYVDVPVPGETYVTSLPAIERFLDTTGYADLLPAREQWFGVSSRR
jgi:S1-C subfamily serine protease